MKKLMMLLFSLVSAAGFVAIANAKPPICPSISEIIQTELEDTYVAGDNYGYVAYYPERLPLGTDTKWLPMVTNLDVTGIRVDAGDAIDRLLDQAHDVLSQIDIQENHYAEPTVYRGVPLYVCYYRSSNPKVSASLKAAAPRLFG